MCVFCRTGFLFLSIAYGAGGVRGLKMAATFTQSDGDTSTYFSIARRGGRLTHTHTHTRMPRLKRCSLAQCKQIILFVFISRLQSEDGVRVCVFLRRMCVCRTSDGARCKLCTIRRVFVMEMGFESENCFSPLAGCADWVIRPNPELCRPR